MNHQLECTYTCMFLVLEVVCSIWSYGFCKPLTSIDLGKWDKLFSLTGFFHRSCWILACCRVSAAVIHASREASSEHEPLRGDGTGRLVQTSQHASIHAPPSCSNRPLWRSACRHKLDGHEWRQCPSSHLKSSHHSLPRSAGVYIQTALQSSRSTVSVARVPCRGFQSHSTEDASSQ